MKEMLRTLTTSDEVLERIKAFDKRYVKDWSEWLRVSSGCDFQLAPIPILVVFEFARIMRKWQACRPKSVRSVTEVQKTLDSATEPLRLMGSANLRCFQAPDEVLTRTTCRLWRIFEAGLCSEGNAKVVGISKAILLVTKGRIGPAFDRTVKTGLNAWCVMDCGTYLRALGEIARDLAEFEARESTTLEDLAEKAARRPTAVGRAVDMVWGPRERKPA